MAGLIMCEVSLNYLIFFNSLDYSGGLMFRCPESGRSRVQVLDTKIAYTILFVNFFIKQLRLVKGV